MLINLKNKYKDKKAIVIMGGPSIIKNKLSLDLLKSRSDVIFIEPKTLTPKFLDFKIVPDYILATYPEKLRTNTMQYTFIQAISANYDLEDSLKDEYVEYWQEFLEQFAEYAEIWRINFPHKKYKIKKNIILKNSPNDLLKALPQIPIIAYEDAINHDGFDSLGFKNDVYKFKINNKGFSKKMNADDYNRYFNPECTNDNVIVNNFGSLNSATIGVIPVLNFMGFNQICFIGKDMSMLGAMEYSAEFIFKSMYHYRSFFNSCRNVFSYGFPRGVNRGLLSFIKHSLLNIVGLNKNRLPNGIIPYKDLVKDIWGLKGKFLRNREQFNDYETISKYSSIKFLNVYQPTKYTKPVPGMKNITFKEFLKNY
tara:strand:- start:1394 stop:2494 length:1101 start_codon:yes stop_codon:yes gene_type:complete